MKPHKWILWLCWSEAWEENALMWTLSYFLDTATLLGISIGTNFSKCQTIILTNQILKLKKIIQLMTTDGSKHSILVAFTRSLCDFLLRVNLEFHQWESWLTGGNWQKWKRVFLTCPCHEIYRDEAVGLKSWKNTWKITIFVKMWNLGQYHENLIFCQ